AAPIRNGARPIASSGKSEAPLRTTNSRMPVRAMAIGVPTKPSVVNARGDGVVAPNPMVTAISESAKLALGQPVRTSKSDVTATKAAAGPRSSTAIRGERKGGAREDGNGRVTASSAER